MSTMRINDPPGGRIERSGEGFVFMAPHLGFSLNSGVVEHDGGDQPHQRADQGHGLGQPEQHGERRQALGRHLDRGWAGGRR